MSAQDLAVLGPDRRVLHVYPTRGRAHETEGAPCWCEPVRESVPRGDGTYGVLVIHREPAN